MFRKTARQVAFRCFGMTNFMMFGALTAGRPWKSPVRYLSTKTSKSVELPFAALIFPKSKAIVLLVEQTREGGLRFKETKSGKVRVNALSEETVGALRRHRARQNQRRLLLGPGYRDDGLVFSSADGSPWNPDYFGKGFASLVARTADVPRIRFHDLRHTSATTLLRAGVATKVVSERLGHSTTTLTTDTYQHVIAGMDEDAAAMAGQALREARARHTSA